MGVVARKNITRIYLMAKYQLLDISLKQSFANRGIKQRVPYTLPAADDDLNWLEGFTDAYQRPVIPDNLGEKSGRYIRMGQINQILENVSQAFLNVKQSLDNVSETIDKGIKVEIDKVITDANNALTNRKVLWLQTKGNQSAAGLKNFTGININNFKTKGNAVANLEWCNYIPSSTIKLGSNAVGFNSTCTLKACMAFRYMRMSGSNGVVSFRVNGNIFDETDDDHPNNPSYIQIATNSVVVKKGDVLTTTITKHHFYGLHITQYI